MTGLSADLLFTLFSSHYLYRKKASINFPPGQMNVLHVPLYGAYLHVYSKNTRRGQAGIDAIKLDIHIGIRQERKLIIEHLFSTTHLKSKMTSFLQTR